MKVRLAASLPRTLLITAALIASVLSPGPASSQEACGRGGCPILPNAALTPGSVRTTDSHDICSKSTKLVRNVPASEKQQVFDRYHYQHSAFVFEGLAPASVPPATILARGWEPDEAVEIMNIDPTQPGKPGPHNSEFEVDHLISLELGGDNGVENLWPESYVIPWGAHVKDVLENRLHRLVCNGTISVKQAQDAIRHNWVKAYRQYVEGK